MALKNPPREPPPARRAVLLLAGALLLLVLGLFSRSLGNGFVSLDDAPYVTQNPDVRGGLSGAGLRAAFTTTREANWHPLTWISHMADVELYGVEPRGHHRTSVLLHAANALLVFWLLVRLTGRLGPSLAAAAIFAVHPLRVESVAWVAERKDVLCAFFGLLALLAYGRWAKSCRRSALLASLALYAASLLSKPMLVTMPLLLLLLDVWPLERFRRERLALLLREKIPFAALSAASCAVTLWAQGSGGAVAAEASLPFLARASNALVSAVAYIGQAFAPFSLSVLYPHPGKPEPVALACAALLAAVSVAVFLARRSRPYLAVGWFWYLVALLPVLGLVQVGWQARADRYTYLPMLGLTIALVWLVADLAGRSPAGRGAAGALGVLAVAFFSVLTWRQIGYWKDSSTLYAHGIAVEPRSHILLINLGIEEMRQGRVSEGVEHFARAVAIEPRYWYGQLTLGTALARAGRPGEAVPYLEAALAMHPDSAEAKKELAQAGPAAARLRFDRGVALLRQGERARAVEELRAVVQLAPDSRPALTLLAASLATSPGSTPAEGAEAVGLARRLVDQTGGRDPNDLDLLAAAQAQAGSYTEAIATAERAVSLAEAAGQRPLARVIAGRLATYRAGRPYRSGT